MIKNNKLRSLGGNLLFALDIFIAFLLLFEQELVVPAWLQPFGRMHPLVLHFPIVLLLLAMGMQFIRIPSASDTKKIYRAFTVNLLLLGNLFAAITVIMGLFLSKEEGYTGTVLQWHKWTGIGILLLASLMYWFRNATWYKTAIARAAAAATVICLVVAGHYGAALTHGDNFLMGSLHHEEAPVVTLEEAFVYDHVIKPIFEKKCISCHNAEKIKGELLLTDPAAMTHGGKSGKLWEPGNPAASLLLQRVHLGLEDKKHMPPAGKVQLTEAETEILYWWIKRGADFKAKVAALPTNDTLRLLATTFLQPAAPAEDAYDFEPADAKKIKDLTNNYRILTPLSAHSPALEVNVYNRNEYSKKVLEELLPLKKQIVSLNLNKMPVKDADLAVIARFENLRHLYLNFTDINGAGLRELSALPQLQTLSLAGTTLKKENLQSLSNLKKLSKLTIWNAGLTDEVIAQLQASHKSITFVTGFKDDGTPMKLTPPQMNSASVVFVDTLALDLSHSIRGSGIRYTTDGSNPDSLQSPVYKPGIILRDSATIKTKAYKQGWISSDVVIYEFFRSTFLPDSSYYLSLPLARHLGDGTSTYFDGIMGDVLNRYSTKYAGFRGNDLAIVLQYKKPVTLSSVVLHGLHSPGQSVFPPGSILIYGGPDKDHLQLITQVQPPFPERILPPAMGKVECRFKPSTIQCIKIIARPVMKMPVLSPAKGQPALMLIDEIFIN